MHPIPLCRTLYATLLVALLSCTKEASPSTTPPTGPVTETTTYRNPVLPSGPDPWVFEKDGFYYYMHTTGRDLTLWKTAKMSELGTAARKVIWTPQVTGAASRDIWAPELFFVNGKWYIYYTGTDGNDRLEGGAGNDVSVVTVSRPPARSNRSSRCAR